VVYGWELDILKDSPSDAKEFEISMDDCMDC
jgi:hypothetical protein